MSTISASSSGIFNTRRGRLLKENLTAYTFLFPTIILMFIFGIAPVAFAFFVSLHKWRRFPDEYQGLGNYERALGNFGYLLFVWIAIGLAVFAVILFRRTIQKIREEDDSEGWLFIFPALFNTGAILLFINWFFPLLLEIMLVPRAIVDFERTQGEEATLSVFLNELQTRFAIPEFSSAGNTFLLVGIIAIVVSVVFFRIFKTPQRGFYIVRWTAIALLIAGAFLIAQLAFTEIQNAILTAQVDGTDLPIWTQFIFISLGGGVVYIAWKLWQRGIADYDNKNFILMALGGIMLAVGGFILLTELPNTMVQADDDLLAGFANTILYAVGTVPFQLAIGLILAYFLFQDIRGKSLFRLIYFIPYIMPYIATSIVFRILFSAESTSLANNMLGLVGIEPQQWILERTPVGTLLGLPDWLAGPSLALLVIMIYTTWTYIGYDAIIFLAGLGNIPTELYEAAKIDGASGWRIFRHITLPLLSPTTFFLSLIAVIGTFKAFTQIWIMRTTAAGKAVDTASVFIFDELNSNSRYGYASAMAFVLFAVIMVLTLAQNRIASRRVFYG